MRILRVERGDGRAAVTADADSPYRLVVRGRGGDVISNTPVAPLPLHIHGELPSGLISAEVPARGAESIEIRYNDAVLATRVKSASAPRVTILHPRANDRVSGIGETIVRWQASDAESGPLEARVEYSADDGQTFRVVASGVVRNQVSLPGRLFSFSSQARLRVTINDGFNDGVAVSDRFQAEGVPPQVRILDPQSDTSINEDVELHLIGEAYDDQGNPLKEDMLQWYNGDKLLGHGQQLGVSGLSPGLYVIQLKARDAFRRSASASVKVEVIPQSPRSQYPAEQLINLINLIKSFNLPEAIEDNLVKKTQAALNNTLTMVVPAATCGRLTNFLSEVNTQEGKEIRVDQVKRIIVMATQIKTVLGCP